MAMEVGMSIWPPIFEEVVCIAWRICPRSLVCVTRTSGLRRQVSCKYYYIMVRNWLPLACHGHDTDGVLRIRIDFCLEYSVDCIGLRLEAGWLVVPIPHVFRVVNNHHGRFQRHLERNPGG